MTLLITVAGADYALACSDMRITAQNNERFISLDETFNKNVVFHSNGLTANISYTGVARWSVGARTVNLYDLISEAVGAGATKDLAFAPLMQLIIDRIRRELDAPALRAVRTSLNFELHIAGYHQRVPVPLIAVIFTYRRAAPWSVPAEIQYDWQFPDMSIYLKLAERPDVIFGGMDQHLTPTEKQKIFDATSRGGDAFNMARFAASLIQRVSQRTPSVGPKSVSIVLPVQGFLDTNLWERSPTGINAYLPRVVFPNGTMLGPSVFPVDMQLTTNGHLPKQSLFAKSIVASSYKKSLRRRIFRLRGGKAIPGIMGLLMIALFGVYHPTMRISV
jgi:hypothetical protein